MIQYILEVIVGLISGIFLGITGIPGTPIALLALDYFKVSDYKTILGAILFLNLFPISIGSVWEFYKADKIDFKMGWILLLTIIIGSYMSSKYVIGVKNKFSNKMIKYVTAIFSFLTAILFLISAFYENN